MNDIRRVKKKKKQKRPGGKPLSLKERGVTGL